jgi:hypothetical protein
MKMEELWRFTEIDRFEDRSFNKVLDRFFNSGVEGLVKENIQNSLDAKLNGSKIPVEVIIKTGEMKVSDIPGIDEILGRVKVLKGGNSYTDNTVKHLQNMANGKKCSYISFEDINTRGLKGALKGQNNDADNSFSAYAYNKGLHIVDEESTLEKARGGSHGIGKIASNAASDLYMMFFANCDENGNKHLGGTVQLIEHIYRGKCYRSTGYFAKECNKLFYPYENNFNEVFSKENRGLKIIIPYFRSRFNNEIDIVKSICSNFMIAILDGKLKVDFNDKLIDKNTIDNYILNKLYFEQNIDQIKKDFTPLYYKTYQNAKPRKIIIKDIRKEYLFDLYFTYDENIQKGRLGIVRTIGMKIEDMRIKNNSTKPFNALMIPCSVEEDAFIKSLENESHTEITDEQIRDNEERRNAKKFISNLNREIEKIISDYMRESNPPEATIDTADILYTINKQFQNELKKTTATVRAINGNKKKIITKIKQDKYEKRNGKGHESKNEGSRKVKKDLGDDKKMELYEIHPSSVQRVITTDVEHIRFDISKNKVLKKMDKCNIVFAVVDGMGSEYFNEFNLKDSYDTVTDLATNEKLEVDKKAIKSISLKNGVIELKANLMSDYNKTLKFVYFMEV